MEDCEQLQPNDFIFQQDADTAYAAGVTQDWLKSNYSDFITKDTLAWSEGRRQLGDGSTFIK